MNFQDMHHMSLLVSLHCPAAVLQSDTCPGYQGFGNRHPAAAYVLSWDLALTGNCSLKTTMIFQHCLCACCARDVHILKVNDLSTPLVLACQLLTSVWLPWQGFQAVQRLCPFAFACQLMKKEKSTP